MNCELEPASKKCSRCKIVKSLDEFHKQSDKKDGRTSCCRVCKCELTVLNREKNREYYRTYYLKNRDNISAKSRKFYSDNKEKINKKKRCYSEGLASYETYAHQLSVDEAVGRGVSGVLLVSCTYCGKKYTPSVATVRSRLQALKGQTEGECRLYCSEACKQACPSYKRSKHWKNSKVATSREVPAYFRQLVLERDNWTCQKCGTGIEAELHVHHIEGAVQQPGMANDLENGITLCRACHKSVHSQNGCRYHDLKCPEIDIPNVLPCVSLKLMDNTVACPWLSAPRFNP